MEKKIIAKDYYGKLAELVDELKEIVHELKKDDDSDKVIVGLRLEGDVFSWDNLLISDVEFSEAVSEDGEYLMEECGDLRFISISAALSNLVYNYQPVPFHNVGDDRECTTF